MTAGRHDSRWASRTRAREAALRILYQTEIGQLTVADATRMHALIGDTDALGLDDEAERYATQLAEGAWSDRALLDERIAGAAENWRVERMAVLDRLVMRLAIHELLAHPGTPPRVVIDQAIELARRYSGEEAAKFVNGVLDGAFRRLKEEGKVLE